METYTHEQYLSPFSWRYASDDMRRIWGEIYRRRSMRRVWVALATAQHEAGLVSREQLDDLIAHQHDINLERAHEIEAETRHDVMAEIRTYAEQCTIGGGIIHMGATSQDILDNADILRLQEALALINTRLQEILAILAGLIEKWAAVPTMAFTHLQPAEPTTIGYRLAQYGSDLLMDWDALQTVQKNLRGKGMKGAVGSSASYAALLENTDISPAQLDSRVMDILGLKAFDITSQVYSRKQDWHIGNALAGIAGSLYKFAFDLRLLQSPPVGEWAEPFGKKQVGSTAMPFKRNPINAENINSIGRWVVAQIPVLWDNAAHSLLERTLDDSANRRLVLPGIFLAVDEMLLKAKKILSGLYINENGVKRNLQTYAPFSAVERLLMLLTRKGANRQDMHEHLREHSLKAWQITQDGKPNPLLDFVLSDTVILAYLSESENRTAMNAESYIGDTPQRARNLAARIRETINQGQ